MKIQSLKVRGAIGFKKGLGLDEIDVDFSGLSGLVALAGQNGFGKTTLLENLSPYRMFASRDGALRHHFFMRDSFRDLTFEYNNDLYRTLIKVDSESDRTEGFVWKNGQSMVDGKVTNYSRYIENLLGSSNLFYNSVFCAQNSDKMSDMTTGQLKKLFVEFLRLDRLEKYETSAKQCVNVLRGAAQQQERALELLQKRVDELEDTEKKAAALVKEKDSATEIKTQAEEKILLTEKQIFNLKDVVAKNSVNIERRDDLVKDIQAHRDEMTQRYHDNISANGKIEAGINSKQSTFRSYQATLKNKDVILKAADKAKTLQDEIVQARAHNQEKGAALEALYEDGQAMGRKIDFLKIEMTGIENNQSRKDIDSEAMKAHEAMKATRRIIDGLVKERYEAEQSFDLIRIESDIKTCKESMTLLDQRGECPVENPVCSFVVSALKAKDRLVELEKEHQALVDGIKKQVAGIDQRAASNMEAYGNFLERLTAVAWLDYDLKRKDDQALADLRKKISDFETDQENLRIQIRNIQDDRREKGKVIDTLVSDLEQTQVQANQLPEIQKAEAQTEQLEKEIKALETTIQEKRDQYSKNDIQSRSKLRDLEKRLEEINGMIDEKAAIKLTQADDELYLHKKLLKNAFDSIETINTQISVVSQDLKEKIEAEAAFKKAQEELGRVTAESSQWLYLQNACGKGGLQALEIDGVAPLVTGYANDLLTSTFGPNFSVRLITQDPETGKEILDIVVIRGDGSETRLENLSGGEKVWVLKSLRLAMTLVSKQKSGRNFQTILCDEEDGPLDTEKARSFVGLYRSILEVGKFDTCFYISHNPEVVAMADHRILFSGEGVQVE